MARSGMLFALALLVAGAAAPAWAASPLPTGGVTRQEVVDWLKRKGRTAQIKTTSDGTRVVASSVGGVNYDIYFYSCTGERCRGIQYAAGWTGMSGTSYDTINSFTRDNRYLRVYKSGEAVWAEYDVDVVDGASWQMMDDSLAMAQELFGRFKKHFGLE